MRKILLPVLSATLLLLSPNLCAGEGVDDVVKMTQAGISEDVLLAYVQDSKLNYDDLSADDIERLQTSGVPSTVIVAMLDHGKTQADAAPADAAPTDAAMATETAAADTVVAPEPGDANLSYFYEALAPDGRWQQLDGVGWVWQPRIAAQADWRPYCNDGHWVWSDAGWFFESDYRWSWAAFHYGRWDHHDRVGWVWVPGTEWAPAWVSWRESGSHYGWAPLPPDSQFDATAGFSFHNKHVGFSFDFGLTDRDYTFVPAERFLDANLAVVAVAPAHNREIFQQTTIVNNTYVYNDNRIVNNGVPVRQVQQRTHREVETVAITDAKIKAGDPVRGEVRTKNAIAVYRPKIEKAAPKDPPAAIARATHVKRDAKTAAARPINTSRDAAKARVTEELAKRRSAAPRSPAATPAAPAAPASDTAKARAEEAAQRRLEAETKQRQVRENAPEQKQQEVQAREQNRDEAAKAQAERQAKLDAEKNAREQAKQEAAQQREQEKAKAEPAPKPEAAPRSQPAPKPDAGPRVEERAQQRVERVQERDDKRDEQNAKRDERKTNRDDQKRDGQ